MQRFVFQNHLLMKFLLHVVKFPPPAQAVPSYSSVVAFVTMVVLIHPFPNLLFEFLLLLKLLFLAVPYSRRSPKHPWLGKRLLSCILRCLQLLLLYNHQNLIQQLQFLYHLKNILLLIEELKLSNLFHHIVLLLLQLQLTKWVLHQKLKQMFEFLRTC
jgi:hypothetical protein